MKTMQKESVYKKGTAYDQVFQYLIRNSKGGVMYCNYPTIAKNLGTKMITVKVSLYNLVKDGFLRISDKVNTPIKYTGYEIIKYPTDISNLRSIDFAIALYLTKTDYHVSEYKRIAKYFQIPALEVKSIITKLYNKNLINIEWNEFKVLEPLKREVLSSTNNKNILKFISRCTTKRERFVNGSYYES